MRAVWLVCLLVSLPVSLAATLDVHVDASSTTATDGDNCGTSPSSPCATLAGALSSVVAASRLDASLQTFVVSLAPGNQEAGVGATFQLPAALVINGSTSGTTTLAACCTAECRAWQAASVLAVGGTANATIARVHISGCAHVGTGAPMVAVGTEAYLQLDSCTLRGGWSKAGSGMHASGRARVGVTDSLCKDHNAALVRSQLLRSL